MFHSKLKAEGGGRTEEASYIWKCLCFYNYSWLDSTARLQFIATGHSYVITQNCPIADAPLVQAAIVGQNRVLYLHLLPQPGIMPDY